MSGWIVNSEPATVPYGEETTLGNSVIRITPEEGYSIAPGNFMVRDGYQVPPATAYIWTGGNWDDSRISHVSFSQNGGDVLCIPSAMPGSTFTEDTVIFLDIDENPDNPVLEPNGVASINLSYNIFSTAIETVTLFNGTEHEVIFSGVEDDSDSFRVVKLKVAANEVTPLHMATLNVAPNVGYHFHHATSLIYGSNPSLFTIEQRTLSDGSVELKLYYSGGTSSQDVECNAMLSSSVDPDGTVAGNIVDSVRVSGGSSFTGGVETVTVTGAPETEYKVTVRDSSNNDYYQWDGTWGSGAASEAGEISSFGVTVHEIQLGTISATRAYNIILSTTTGADLSSPDVPTSPGDLSLMQYGVNTLTIRPKTEDPTDYGTLPSDILVTRPIRYEGDSYTSFKRETVNCAGYTRLPGKRVVIGKARALGVKAGMKLTGEGIPHNTIIQGVSDDVILTNTDLDIPSSIPLIAVKDSSDVVPFAFTILPNGTNTLSVNGSNNHSLSIWGFEDRVTEFNLDTLGSNNFKVVNSYGVLRDMEVKGTGVPAGTVVTDVDYRTHVVTVAPNHSGVADKDQVAFRGANNPRVSVYSITASMSGSNVVISGYLYVPIISNSANVEIFIDDIINIT